MAIRELLEVGATIFLGLCALWYLGRPKPPRRRSLISRVLK